MAIDDHGLEAMRKSAELVTAGDKSDTYLKTSNINSFVKEQYDYIALTYVAAGNGAGEIETATYKSGGASGTTVAILTITYDANDRISTVTRT